jgi:hypothetical protein
LDAILTDMMERQGGALQWCSNHNSKLSLPKTVYMLFMRKSGDGENGKMVRKPLHIDGTDITASPHAKYLGVFMDQELRWKEQCSQTVKKATQVVTQYRLLTRVTKGTSALAMQQLYIAVVVPKMLYAADVWISPP